MINKIRVFEAFAGYGSQSIALRNIGVPHEVVAISEIDKYALQAYYSIHDKNIPNLGDISKLNVEDIPDHDLFTYSFPCFIAGTKVMTDKGYKNIEDIKTGDRVLTHTNSYQEVVKPMINKANHLYKIDTMCSETLYTTEEHPFYIRKKYYEYDSNIRYDNDKIKKLRKFDDPKWIKAKDLNKDCYVGIAINQESKLPNWKGITFHWNDGRKDRYSNILKDKFSIPEFWWLIGRYIGDGWIRSQGGIIICCDYGKENEIIPKLDILGFNYSISNERTVIKIHIAFKEIEAYVEQFGKGVSNKHLTSDIFDLPIDLLKEFIEGYKSADGCVIQDMNKITSTSKELIYGIGQCVAKVYNRPFSIYHTKRNPTCIIEGRVVNQKDTYTITWKYECKKQDKAFYDGKYIWCPINKVEKIDYDGLVYNMEVSNDNSYTVNNIIVHNCTDISVAGKQEGIIKGKTRSGLLYECERIIEGKRPKYLLLENVKNLVGKKFKPQFNEWLEYLKSLGYTNYWKVLNAKDYGIPQNRERVFVVSILNDTQGYEFPEPFKLDKCIKDILEDEVDEKYYLSDEIIKKFKPNKNFSTGVIRGRYDKEGKIEQQLELRDDNITNTITTAQKDNVIVESKILDVGFIKKSENGKKHQSNTVIHEDYLMRTLAACDYKSPQLIITDRLPSILRYERTEYGKSIRKQYEKGEIKEKRNNMRELKPRKDGISNTITTVQKDNYLLEPNYRIRKLTPKECFRFMGMNDEDIEKIQSTGVSNTQQYKMAGNSIVVDVLEAIFKNLFL